jgi:ABC-type nickel/cobalt efflux system permease component RcnA
MADNELFSRLTWVSLLIAGILLAPRASTAHPLGNFSINHYAGIRIERDVLELHYLIDMAEIPTFQELQETGIAPEVGHHSVNGYLAREAERLKEGLHLEVNGRGLQLRAETAEVIFHPGAGGLPTLKLGILYRAGLDDAGSAHLDELRYRDVNFPGRAGWKEIVAVAGQGVAIVSSSVPSQDRSLRLTDYSTELLNSPPQDLEARVIFLREEPPRAVAPVGSPDAPSQEARPQGGAHRTRATEMSTPEQAVTAPLMAEPVAGPSAPTPPLNEAWTEAGLRLEPIPLQANRQATPRNAFTELVTTKQLGVGIVLIAITVAAGLGALHALEPGHGKTVVAAYLVGSRGTAWHALVLGLIVTGSHTAGVYLLGAATLFASQYMVPERLYPWLGAVSGLTIAGLGVSLFLRRYAGGAHLHSHNDDYAPAHQHRHPHGEAHRSDGPDGEPYQPCGAYRHRRQEVVEQVSPRDLLALGVTGGIVPCPAALVVLLSALSLRRIGFGLLLIVAFSVGLATVLIAIGLLLVYARRFMVRFQGEGSLITRWLPLTSAAVITLFGMAMLVQALVTALSS